MPSTKIFSSNSTSMNIARPPLTGSNNINNNQSRKSSKLPMLRRPVSGAKRTMTTTKQQQQAFRQKVATANETAICTATSNQVGRRTLRQMLLPTENNNNNSSSSNDYEAYIVPIFQRRYCWTTPQWDTLWMDFTKRSSIRHSLGRLTCTIVPESIYHNQPKNCTESSSDSSFDGISQNHNNSHRSIIIDGQQRFTTITLILAAIRDALLSLNDIDSTNDDPLLESINRMIFLDVHAMNEWIGSSDNNSAIKEGIALDFCRLIPTYCDRSSYLAAILPPTSPQVQKFLSDAYNPRWHRPVLAKKHFARRIDYLLSASNKRPRKVLDQLTKSLLDGVDILYFPVDVSRGYQDGTEDTQVIYERLAIRDATWCKPTRSSEYHSMDGIDMIRNLFLGSFDTPDSKTNFYKTFWLPLERMYQTTTGNDTNDKKTNNNKDEDDEEQQSLKAIVEAFLEHERSKLNLEQRQHQPWAGASKLQQGLLAASVDIGGRIYKDFESWMAFDYQIWQQTTRTEEDKQRQQWSVLSFWTTSSPSSSHSSAAEDHTRDVGKRLLEFAKGRRIDVMSR